MPPRTYECPSPDDCEFVGEDTAELLEHVNTEHAGEFKREDWPDTEVARARRAGDRDDEEE